MMKAIVIEVCPHCDEEVEFMWDTDEKGYQAFCPNCGNELMLCSECFDAYDNIGQSCDWSEDKGCFRKRKNK